MEARPSTDRPSGVSAAMGAQCAGASADARGGVHVRHASACGRRGHHVGLVVQRISRSRRLVPRPLALSAPRNFFGRSGCSTGCSTRLDGDRGRSQKCNRSSRLRGTPGGTRTPDPQVRRQTRSKCSFRRSYLELLTISGSNENFWGGPFLAREPPRLCFSY
jgi:hypothetical protein